MEHPTMIINTDLILKMKGKHVKKIIKLINLSLVVFLRYHWKSLNTSVTFVKFKDYVVELQVK